MDYSRFVNETITEMADVVADESDSHCSVGLDVFIIYGHVLGCYVAICLIAIGRLNYHVNEVLIVTLKRLMETHNISY